MSDHLFIARSVNASSGTTVPKTFLRVSAPANHRVVLLQYNVSYQGTSTTATPHVWRLARQSTDGTNTAVTLVDGDDSISETILSTAAELFTGAEPTTGDVLDEHVVHTQTGLIIPVPRGEFVIGGSDRMALILVEAAAATDVSVTMRFEE